MMCSQDSKSLPIYKILPRGGQSQTNVRFGVVAVNTGGKVECCRKEVVDKGAQGHSISPGCREVVHDNALQKNQTMAQCELSGNKKS